MKRSLRVGLIFLGALPGNVANAQAVQGDTVTVMSGALKLKALLWRPDSSARVAAVLFTHGGTCLDFPAWPASLGQRFIARGYAFLWLYRRGAGASRGQGECAFEQIQRVRTAAGDSAALSLQVELLTTTELSDVLAGLATLKALPGIDPARVVVAGHSFGGQLAMLAGARDSSVRAVMNFVGAAAIWNRDAVIRAKLTQAAAALSVPVYLGYATDDNDAPGTALGAELKRLGKVHQLAIYPTGGHNFVFVATHPADVDIFQFLETHVKR